MRVRTFLIGALAACGLAIAATGTAAAQPAAPPVGYSIYEKYTQKSPDGSVTIEQYLNQETDDWKWLFFARTQGTFTQLDPEPAGYGAQFLFSNDLKWIIRSQKIGSGTSTTRARSRRVNSRPTTDASWRVRRAAGARRSMRLMITSCTFSIVSP